MAFAPGLTAQIEQSDVSGANNSAPSRVDLTRQTPAHSPRACRVNRVGTPNKDSAPCGTLGRLSGQPRASWLRLADLQRTKTELQELGKHGSGQPSSWEDPGLVGQARLQPKSSLLSHGFDLPPIKPSSGHPDTGEPAPGEHGKPSAEQQLLDPAAAAGHQGVRTPKG